MIRGNAIQFHIMLKIIMCSTILFKQSTTTHIKDLFTIEYLPHLSFIESNTAEFFISMRFAISKRIEMRLYKRIASESGLSIVSGVSLKLITAEFFFIEMKLFVIFAIIVGIFAAYTAACCCPPTLCLPVCDNCKPFPG